MEERVCLRIAVPEGWRIGSRMWRQGIECHILVSGTGSPEVTPLQNRQCTLKEGCELSASAPRDIFPLGRLGYFLKHYYQLGTKISESTGGVSQWSHPCSISVSFPLFLSGFFSSSSCSFSVSIFFIKKLTKKCFEEKPVLNKYDWKIFQYNS